MGKLITGTVIVDNEGNLPGFWKAFLRTLARLIEVNPILLGGLPAALFVLNTRERQRLGDLMAGTYVLPVRELREAQARRTAEGVA